jgi:phosphoribosylaminoimidazolecarboxamide formyltransferase/IMP cyclohydrolase
MPLEIAGPELLTVKRALISVYDKTGNVELVQALAAHGAEIISTGGTAKALLEGRACGDRCRRPHRHAGDDGRAREDPPSEDPRRPAGASRRTCTSRGDADARIEAIDCLVSNLYPSRRAVARGAGAAETIENIDIGGPAMIRAAAKMPPGLPS